MSGAIRPDSKLAMRTIVVGRDFGAQVEVLSGIGKDDRVVVNPPDSAVDGMEVRIAQPKAGGKDGQSGAPASAQSAAGKPAAGQSGSSKPAAAGTKS